MKSDWSEKVRDKLSESTATPPNDLWAGISSQLDAAMPPRPMHNNPKQWRWWTVAACLAAAVVLYLMYNAQFTMHNSEDEPRYAVVDEAVINEQESNDILPNDEIPPVVTPNANKHLSYTSPTTSKNSPQLAPIKDGELPAPTTQAQTYDEVFNAGEVQTTNTPGKKDQNAIIIMASNEDQDDRLTNRKGASSSSSLSIGLYASNTNMPSLGTGDMAMSPVYSEFPWGGGNAVSSTDDPQSFTLKEAKHRHPLRFGLSVRLPVSSSISLSSGLVYSRLSSTMTWESAKGASIETSQTLNYIGIPASIEYCLPSYRSAGFYLTAGTMVEKCIYGESKSTNSPVTEKVSENALQLSVFAGAGVQLNLNRHISIYAEPLATFYIDNHSGVKNIYKDRPLNFDLRVGVRYNLK